jgi:hypothetical protein
MTSTTGYFAGIIDRAVGAQHQQPPPECFKVEMSHSTQGNPQGSILLDRCTVVHFSGLPYRTRTSPPRPEDLTAGRRGAISTLALSACLAFSYCVSSLRADFAQLSRVRHPKHARSPVGAVSALNQHPRKKTLLRWH